VRRPGSSSSPSASRQHLDEFEVVFDGFRSGQVIVVIHRGRLAADRQQR